MHKFSLRAYAGILNGPSHSGAGDRKRAAFVIGLVAIMLASLCSALITPANAAERDESKFAKRNESDDEELIDKTGDDDDDACKDDDDDSEDGKSGSGGGDSNSKDSGDDSASGSSGHEGSSAGSGSSGGHSADHRGGKGGSNDGSNDGNSKGGDSNDSGSSDDSGGSGGGDSNDSKDTNGSKDSGDSGNSGNSGNSGDSGDDSKDDDGDNCEPEDPCEDDDYAVKNDVAGSVAKTGGGGDDCEPEDPCEEDGDYAIHKTGGGDDCDEPDLEVYKTASAPHLTQGGTATFTITARNAGTGDATGVVVRDELADDVWFTSATSTKGTCAKSGAVVTCNIGTLAAGESAKITLVTKIDTCDKVYNTATVDGDAFESDIADNTSTTSVTPDCDPVEEEEPDLEITKVDNADPIEAGGELIYTITVRNLGAETAHDVIVSDVIDHENWRLWAAPTTSQGNCAPSDADTGDVITCQLGSLAGGATATIELKVKPRFCGDMVNTATVTTSSWESSVANNQAIEYTLIEGNCDKDPDMSITTKGPKKLFLGRDGTYTLSIHQGGPEHGTGITVTDKVPANLEVVSASASQGSCLIDDQKVICVLGEMVPYTDAQVEITVKARYLGKGTNHAEVEVNEYDAVMTNNVSKFTTKVRQGAKPALF